MKIYTLTPSHSTDNTNLNTNGDVLCGVEPNKTAGRGFYVAMKCCRTDRVRSNARRSIGSSTLHNKFVGWLLRSRRVILCIVSPTNNRCVGWVECEEFNKEENRLPIR